MILVLDHLYDQRMPGDTQLLQSDASDEMNKLIQMALQSQDELLHVAVFDWMVSKHLTSELITVQQPSLETYLVRTCEQSPDLCDLLWKYYEKSMNHAAAAKVLHKLALRPGTSVTLPQRIEYLARAVMCMRSDQVGCAPQLGVFLRELEDMIDVARIQQQVLEAVIKLKGRHRMAEDAILRLNSSLLEITQVMLCHP